MQFELYSRIEEIYSLLSRFQRKFYKKFQDLNGSEVELLLFQQLFHVNVEDITHAEIQLEVLNLQPNTSLEAAFLDHRLIEFYRRLAVETYPTILQNARFWICQFDNIYCCEQ